MSEPDRPFIDFYESPTNAHYNMLGYDAMADMVIHHIKGGLREAVEMLKKEASALEEGDGAAEESQSSLSLTLEEDMVQLPDWKYEAPLNTSEDFQIMNNEDYLSHTVTFYVPSPHDRDLKGVQIECRKDDGTTTMEDGMIHDLPKLIEEKGCSNLKNVSVPGRRREGRLDYEVDILLPYCGRYPEEAYKLFIPFSFQRVGGIVAWPPTGLQCHVNDVLVNSTSGKPVLPVFELDSPTPADGVYLRFCSPREDKLVTMHKRITFS